MAAFVLSLNEESRITSVCIAQPGGNYKGFPVVESIPDGDLLDYRYVDGLFVYDPLPEPEPDTPAEPAGDLSVWDELDAAYQEGVDSV